jgi:hypothetical protein
MDTEKAELFEVFRLGPIEKATILQTPLAEVQAKYTILNAVTSMEQIQSAQALASFPPPGKLRLFFFSSRYFTFSLAGHIIVDRAQFMQMFVQQSQKSVEVRFGGLNESRGLSFSFLFFSFLICLLLLVSVLVRC